MSIYRSLIVVLASLLALLGANPTFADSSTSTSSAARFNPPGRYYLALGDSLAFGYQQARFDSNFPLEPAGAYNTGYVDHFATMLTNLRPTIQTINDSCPGETSNTFLNGGCQYSSFGFALHNSYSGSQMDAALAFLQAHRGTPCQRASGRRSAAPTPACALPAAAPCTRPA